MAARSLKWTWLIEILSRASTPIVLLVLAALLPPRDFGVLASATVVVSFTQLFLDNGFGRALVQYNGESLDRVANATFWLTLALGCALYLGIFAVAPWAAAFFRADVLTDVIRAMGVQILLASTSSVQQALLQREFAFKKLVAVKLASSLIPGVVAIFLAWQGYGVWSLVVGGLATAAVNSIALWGACPWKPRFQVEWRGAAPILAVGAWTIAEASATWAVFWSDIIVGGYFLSIDQLGVYRTAGTIVLVFFTLTLNPLVLVLYPYFSRLQGDTARLRDVFGKLGKLVAAAALPVGLTVAWIAPALVPIVFNDDWIGLGAIVALLAVREGIGWIASINPELYRALGRPDINVKVILVAVFLVVPTYLVAAPFGLLALATAKLVVTPVTLGVHALFTARLLRIPTRSLWHAMRPAVAGSVAMIIVATSVQVGLSALLFGPLFVGAAAASVGLVAYGLITWRIDPELISMASRLVHRAAS